MKPVVLLDLGNTLVRYYELKDFQPILQSGIRQAMCYLDGAGFPLPPSQQVLHNVSEEDYESPDHRVRPLEDRLKRIFGLKEVLITPPVLDEMCRHFMAAIFACARVYDDTLPFLRELRLQGFDTGIISNAPWGSPSHLWHEELERHGLDRYVEHAIFCSEVGWRKPAPAISLPTSSANRERRLWCTGETAPRPHITPP